MGGKPSKQTPADMRLKANQQKYGNVANRDQAKSTKSQPAMPPAKKDNK